MKKFLSVFVLCSVITLGYAQIPKPTEKNVHLQFSFNDLRSDTLSLNVFAQKLGSSRIGANNYHILIVKGKGEIRFPLENDLSYIHIESNQWPRLYMDNFLAEPGDQVMIAIDTSGKKSYENIMGKGLSCEGVGSHKYEARFRLNQWQEIRSKRIYAAGPPRFLEQRDMEGRWGYYDSSISMYRDTLLDLINPYEKRVSPLAFTTMKADIYYSALESLLEAWGTEWSSAMHSPDSTNLFEKLKELYQSRFVDEKERQLTSNEGRARSWACLEYMIRRTFASARTTNPDRFRHWPDAIAYFPILRSVSQPQFDRLAAGFMAFLVSYTVPSPHPEELLDQIMREKTSEPYKHLLEEMQQRFFAVKACYPFSLTGMDGKKVSLEDLKGKKLLIDFWFTGCIPCMQLTKRLKELHEQLKDDESFTLVSICTDQDERIWKESVASGKYTSKEHLNLYTEGLRSQHPFLQYYGLGAVPRLLLVDSRGRLQNSNVLIPVNSADVLKLADLIRSTP